MDHWRSGNPGSRGNCGSIYVAFLKWQNSRIEVQITGHQRPRRGQGREGGGCGCQSSMRILAMEHSVPWHSGAGPNRHVVQSHGTKHTLTWVHVKLEKSEQGWWVVSGSISWLWYYCTVVILEDVILGETGWRVLSLSQLQYECTIILKTF